MNSGARQPRRRGYYATHLVALCAFWGLTIGLGAWFGVRTAAAHAIGESAVPTLVVGSLTTGIFLLFAGLSTFMFRHVAAQPDADPTELPDGLAPLAAGALRAPSWRWWGGAALLALPVLAAFWAWWQQLTTGLVVTGLGRPVFWGLYIVDFVFFIGISYGGTLVSAVLRVAGADWRHPITRAAEVLAVLALLCGAWNIALDLGRPDRLALMITSGRPESPLLWDVFAISTYLFATLIYLYLPLIPDLAALRTRVGSIRRPIYHLLSLGWSGDERQRAALERAIGILAIAIIPIAITVHSVVGWVFSMTILPTWHSTIFGPYFVLGAVFSGLAALLVVLAILRQTLRLQDWIFADHFRRLAGMLLVLSFTWAYFTFAEHLTIVYGAEPSELGILHSKVEGRYAVMFWAMMGFNVVLPVVMLLRSKWRTISRTVIASLGVCAGMWIERYLIVVPALERPRMEGAAAVYFPSVFEITIALGNLAALALGVMLVSRIIPVVSIWENHRAHGPTT